MSLDLSQCHKLKHKILKTLIVFILLFVCCSAINAQTATELYASHDYKALVQLESKSDNLSAEELSYVGFAFFQTGNDDKAVQFYDKAIAKGLNNGSVHFYKGMSLRLLKKYSEALTEIDKSLVLEPTNQEFMNEKGMVYYNQKNTDKALAVFEEAKKLPTTYPEPYFWVSRIYHEKQDFTNALRAYYEAEKYMPKDNSYYFDAITAIGQLEFTFTKDYKKSAAAYEKAIEIHNDDYEIYYKLMKSYNAAKEFTKADSVFAVVKEAYNNNKLPKEDMEIKTVAIAQFEWNGQIASVRKSLVDAKEMLDITYKVFLLNKEGDKIERRFMVEKTLPIAKKDAHFLLCEQDKKSNTHYTYLYGWVDENIHPDELEKAVKLVLDGKMKPGASSHPGK